MLGLWVDLTGTPPAMILPSLAPTVTRRGLTPSPRYNSSFSMSSRTRRPILSRIGRTACTPRPAVRRASSPHSVCSETR